MRRLVRFTVALAAFVFAAAASAEKRDVIIQCASSCDAAAATVASVGGSVNIRYTNVPAIAASVPAEQLTALTTAAGIKAVAKDRIVSVPTPGDGAARKGVTVGTLEAPEGVQVLSGPEIAGLPGAQPADYLFNNNLINATPLLVAGNQGDGVIVAVIDTGTTNAPVVPALTGTVIGGENFVTADPVQSATSRRNDPHGTWVGTVIASHVSFGFSNASRLVRALKLNGAGTFTNPCPNPPAVATCFMPMIGVAPLSKIYALKVFDSRGGGAPESRIIAAMDRAITLKRNFNAGMSTAPVAGDGTENNPFRFNALNIGVVNMSLGGGTLFAGRDLEDQLTQQMIAENMALAASAGNEGFAAMTTGSPSTGFGALSVAATSDPTHERILIDAASSLGFGAGAFFRPTTHQQTADFSSRGPTSDGRSGPNVTANGVATIAQGTCSGSAGCLAGTALAPISFVSGTSFSSPTAAGAMALLRKAAPAANAAQIRNSLIATANAHLLGDGSGEIDQGAGHIDVAAAASALASGTVSSTIPVSNPNTGNEGVITNVHHFGFDTVNFNGDRFTTHLSNLKPGQVTQFFLRSRIDTTRFVVNVKNVTPANPPAGQNLIFGDDVIVQVNDAVTSSSDPLTQAFVASSFTFPLENPQSGLVRVAVMGDWTNAGLISADVEIIQQRDSLPQHTSKGALSQDSLTSVAIDIPAGTHQAVFELFWDQDWGSYPTNDIDLVIVKPDNTANFDGATEASPERVVLANPAAGRYTAFVSGFQVNAKDKFTLRVTADGNVLKEAKK